MPDITRTESKFAQPKPVAAPLHSQAGGSVQILSHIRSGRGFGLQNLRLIERSHVHVALGGPCGASDVAKSSCRQIEEQSVGWSLRTSGACGSDSRRMCGQKVPRSICSVPREFENLAYVIVFVDQVAPDSVGGALRRLSYELRIRQAVPLPWTPGMCPRRE